MSSTDASPGSAPSTKLTLKCHQWMDDIWRNLAAKVEARDTDSNAINTKILGMTTGQIQSKLRAKLSEQKCSLTVLLDNRPGINRRTKAYQDRATRVRRKALATISETNDVNTGLPKLSRLSEKTRISSWVKKSIETYGQYIASDSVEFSIKPRLRRIRQILRSYHKTGKASGMGIAKGCKPSRSDFECLSIEVAAMLTITSAITKYSHILKNSLVDAKFRPRVVETVRLLKSYQENGFQLGPEMNTIRQWEKQIQKHMDSRSRGMSSLAEEEEESEF